MYFSNVIIWFDDFCIVVSVAIAWEIDFKVDCQNHYKVSIIFYSSSIELQLSLQILIQILDFDRYN